LFDAETLLKARERAFSVAQAMPAPRLAELQNRIGLLVATGASFHEAKTVLQQPFSARA
jgi:hypothetical protein